MTEPLVWVPFGQMPYEAAWAWQADCVQARLRGEISDLLLLGEHPPVYTLGRGTHAENLGDPGEIPVVSIERGGDITYHGPGQLVGYPIVQLKPGERDLKRLLWSLEQGLIDALAEFDVAAERELGKTGVWIAGAKVASIGVAVKKCVTYHGFALNVSTDMAPFGRIRPCGFDASVMTRLVDAAPHVDWPAQHEDLSQAIHRHLAGRLGRIPDTAHTALLPPVPCLPSPRMTS